MQSTLVTVVPVVGTAGTNVDKPLAVALTVTRLVKDRLAISTKPQGIKSSISRLRRACASSLKIHTGTCTGCTQP